MAVARSLSIANIAFRLSPDLRCPVHTASPRYTPFLRRSRARAGAVTVPVRLVTRGTLDLRGWSALLSSAEGWTMLQRGRERCVVSHPPSFSRPLWMCRFDRSPRAAIVYCSADLLKRRGGRVSLRSPLVYPLDLVLLMYVLAARHGVLLHSAGAIIDGRAVLFPGRSGTGKTTLMGHVTRLEGVGTLSDDRIVVRRSGGLYAAWGTPWAGTGGVARNEGRPLQAVCFLHQARVNRIRRCGKARALEQLLPVASIPWYDRDVLAGVLDSCARLADRVPAFDLWCRNDVSAAEMVAESMRSLR